MVKKYKYGICMGIFPVASKSTLSPATIHKLQLRKTLQPLKATADKLTCRISGFKESVIIKFCDRLEVHHYLKFVGCRFQVVPQRCSEHSILRL